MGQKVELYWGKENGLQLSKSLDRVRNGFPHLYKGLPRATYPACKGQAEIADLPAERTEEGERISIMKTKNTSKFSGRVECHGDDRLISSEGICDFCSSPEIFCTYSAADFEAAEVRIPELGSFLLNSLGAWLACRDCACFIEAERWEDLLERSFRTFCELHGAGLTMTPADEIGIREFIGHVHAQFRRFRQSATVSASELSGIN